MRFVDNFLNGITMYRMVLYGLTALTFLAILFGFLGVLPYAGYWLFASAAILLASCYISNYIFAKIFSVPVNVESSFITALILFLIMTPPSVISDLKILALTGIIAMASKYLIAPLRRHIFNPAAFSAAAIFLLGLGGAAWWVETPVMFPAILIVGFLIVKKIRRFDLFLPFLVAGLTSIIYFGIINGLDPITLLRLTLLSGPIFFFGTIMLTEPITTPPTRRLRIIYAVIIGVFYSFLAPEFILLVGNIFSYFAGFNRKLILTLKEKRPIANDIYEFILSPDRPVAFTPGQYLEYTLPHQKSDSRGNRRYFTIAASPTEGSINIGAKFNNPPSSFKRALAGMRLGEKISAGQLAGDFVLPRDKNLKIVFITGGIGVTPYRSMIKYLVDSGERRDIILLYAAKLEGEIAYRYLLNEAGAKIGLRTEYIISKLIDAALVRNKVPDWRERIFYISGPEAMVSAFKKMLRRMGVARRKIVTDYFPGFA